MNLKNSPEHPGISVANRLPLYSDAFYERSKIDPFDYTNGNSAVREKIRQLDVDGLADATRRYDVRETAEFAADLAVLGLIEDTTDTRAYATIASNALQQSLKSDGLKPSDRISLWGRLLDMTSLQALDDYQRAASALGKEKKTDALSILEARQRSVITKGTGLLREMQQQLTVLNDRHDPRSAEEASILVGKMFELLYVTNKRREIYDRETYDDVLVVGATTFQDASALQFSPSHNFDVMEVSASTGEVSGLAQCKAGKNSKEYAKPITMVSGSRVGRFFNDPAPFIDAMGLIVSNEANVTEHKMKQSVELINSLFERDVRQSGAEVLKMAVVH